MKIEIDTSFVRDAKKLSEPVLDELKIVNQILGEAQSLDDVVYSIKKMEGSRKVKAFRLRLSENSDYRIGFYLEGDTIVLSRILNRKDIYKKFPPKK
ncbi:type II toxin-antitoxin system RelE/ParE family toxin [Spirosoma sp. KCTC 42546]|uniref:type II toxin-antitoxin system RelE family toxin n=1 Tax=Spirosoma sp. KCTC 42546 TaxID=2520506 RepID=UPI00115B3F40|nr:type II toxin-antitoxin system RelE/ParE family toxin [Spirosoma sp. KCTC 42546]QDK81451.1 type II toxin-antitoxin system RelE/ParE family toxin [Spirosoma sp. KCTC 42546]